jgi:hypothetical protein
VFFETLEHRVEHPDRGLCRKVPERRAAVRSGPESLSTSVGRVKASEWRSYSARDRRLLRERKASSGMQPGPRHGKGEPQGGRNPGVPGKPWPAEKSSGGDPNRQRDETPGAKPRGPYGGSVPATARIHLRMEEREVPGGAKRRRGKSCRETRTISVESSAEGWNPMSEPG